MNAQVWMGILLPFLGTSLGAAMVFVLKDRISDGVQRMLTGFAAGVMVAMKRWRRRRRRKKWQRKGVHRKENSVVGHEARDRWQKAEATTTGSGW